MYYSVTEVHYECLEAHGGLRCGLGEGREIMGQLPIGDACSGVHFNVSFLMKEYWVQRIDAHGL